MAEIVKAHLRRDASFDPAPAEAWVKTLVVGKDARFENGKLRVEFEGSRVDVVCQAGSAAPAAVSIDGRKPSEFPELYGCTRAVTTPPGKWLVKWPIVAPIGSEKPLLVEDWTLDVKRADPANEKLFTFTLTGSKTGADGEGRSDARFVSKSDRIVIAPEDWNAAYALALQGIKPVPDVFAVQWKVEARLVDAFVSPGVENASVETTVTLAQGLANTKHTLEISGGAETIAALRVYRPPLTAKDAK